MNHRRATPRVAITLDLMLLRSKGKEVSGRTIDLSAGGMRVATDRPLAVDEVLRFDMGLDGTQRRQLDGRARVLRMQGPNVYALRFEDLDETDRLLLTRMASNQTG